MRQIPLQIPTTKRLLYTELKKFVDDTQDFVPSIGIVSGLRKTGKTTLLHQIAEEYRERKKIVHLNFRDGIVYSSPYDESLRGCTAEDVVYKLLSGDDSKFDLFLLDEITSLENYEIISGNLYNNSGGPGPGWRYKVIMTGSSPFHLHSLSSGSLGAGRSKLFRLPVLKFIEYLHIVKNVPYNDYSGVTREDFIDYLILKDLPSDILRTFDQKYFVDYRNDVEIGDEMTYNSRGYAGLGSEDLKDLAHVLSYQLAFRVGYDKFARTTSAGKHELGPLQKHKKFDLSQSLIYIRSQNIDRMKSDSLYESIANLLHFLIGSDMVNIETTLSYEEDEAFNSTRLSRCVKNLQNRGDFLKFFEKCSISMNSPLLYSRLGDDVLSFVDLSLVKFFELLQSRANGLLGDLLEVYLRGGIAELDTLGLPYASKKLQIGHDVEIDVINTDISIMCESTVKNKDRTRVYVADYFKDREMIRVCTTYNLLGMRDCYHMYPWPVFCCMVDTRDVLKLPKTKHSDYLGDWQEKIT